MSQSHKPTYEELENKVRELKKIVVDTDLSQKRFEDRNKSYKVLVDMSSRCINIPIDNVENAIQTALTQIGKFVYADRAYIFKYDFEKDIGINTYEWCTPGIEPQIQNLQESPIQAFGDWVTDHLNRLPVIIPLVADLQYGHMREILEEQEIKSLLSVPMFREDELVGFSGFDSVKEAHEYSSDEIEIVRIFGGIITSLNMRTEQEKERKKMIKDLQEVLEKVKTLSGLVPICASCKKIRDDKGYWNNLEAYVEKHSDATFSHGMCPECSDELYGRKGWYLKMKKDKKSK